MGDLGGSAGDPTMDYLDVDIETYRGRNHRYQIAEGGPVSVYGVVRSAGHAYGFRASRGTVEVSRDGRTVKVTADIGLYEGDTGFLGPTPAPGSAGTDRLTATIGCTR